MVRDDVGPVHGGFCVWPWAPDVAQEQGDDVLQELRSHARPCSECYKPLECLSLAAKQAFNAMNNCECGPTQAAPPQHKSSLMLSLPPTDHGCTHPHAAR